MKEYLVKKCLYTLPDNLQSMLNFLSTREGWQVINLIQVSNDVLIVFERERFEA